MRKIISSVDLGSDKIKIVVGEIIKNKVHVLSAQEWKSKGIKSGLIINEEEASNSLKDAFKNIENMLGLKIKKTIVNVSAINTEFCLGEGTTSVTSGDKIISGSDIVRALQGSVYNKIPSNMELINLLPVDFIIDENDVVKDPKKIIANKLGVKTVIITGPKKNIYSVLKIFEKLGIEVTDITLGCVGDYYAHHNDEIDDKIGAVINIGADTTTVSIFNKGVLTNVEVVEIGGSYVDNDISFIYKLTKKESKYLKENLALAHKRLADASEVEELTNKLGEKVKISQYELSEIVMSRISEILNLAKKQINLLTKKQISYIIITGGLTEIGDFSLMVEETFGKNVIIGSINELGIRNNKYCTPLGMIKYFDTKLKLRDKSYSIFNSEEETELGHPNKRVNVSNDSIVGKIFGYFFDN